MTSSLGKLWSRATFGLGRAALAGLIATAAAGPALAHDGGGRSGSMLSLGDSVVFGYITRDSPAYVNPDNFLGYPEIVGDSLRLDSVNASCPGETSAGFLSLSPSAPDNGCRPFRTHFPLHESYGTTQLDYALAYLGANKRKTRLVTLSIGANDGFLLQDACKGDVNCILAGLPQLYANVNTILSNLRATGFKGVLMVVNYYSLDYSDPVQTGSLVALNQVLATAAAANGAVVADAFDAFQKVASAAGGKTCLTGLLNGDPQNQQAQPACDVHPSLSGQRLLARVVEAAYRRAKRWDD